MRFYEPTQGRVYFEGEEKDTAGLTGWRSRFGYVLQNAPLFSGTVRENILYGIKGEISDEELIRAAKAADAHEFIMALEQGYDTEVGEGGRKLSGGQRQRVAIARALVMNPDCLLLDEATASLDVQSDRQVWEATEVLMNGKTTIFIAHDMEAVKRADHIILLNRGYLEAAGSHEELLKNDIYREYLSAQEGKEITA